MAGRIAYLGPPGTYSDEAAYRYAPDAERIPYPSLPHVAAAVEAGEVAEAIVPIENSIQGSITDILDFLIRTDRARIRAELVLPVELCLMVTPGARLEDIKAVYSHPQPLGQCRSYLANELPQARLVAAVSTVAAVEDMQKADETAAIGSRRAAEIYGLEILADNIQDNRDNLTRFVVLGEADHPPTGTDKTSLAFDFEQDAPGLLFGVMRAFAERGISLTKVESRPTGRRLGRYIFLVDCEGHRTDAEVSAALEDVRAQTSMLKVFGSYPRTVPERAPSQQAV